MPNYIHQWKSPYELFYTKKPSQEHLHAYTCKAFAMTTDALKKTNCLQRLNPKAWIGYLIGYSSTNIYRIWIPQLNKSSLLGMWSSMKKKDSLVIWRSSKMMCGKWISKNYKIAPKGYPSRKRAAPRKGI